MKVQKINLSMTKAGSYANRRNRDRYEGNKTIVKRANNADGSIAQIPDEDRNWNENESLSRVSQQRKK
jgi:hypothetical protein